MENYNTNDINSEISGAANPLRCPGSSRQRHSLVSNAIDWATTTAERNQLAELDALSDLDDSQLTRDLAGVIAQKSGAHPAMVFACRVMGTVLTEEVLAGLSFEEHHRVAEAIALYETYGEVAWCYIVD